MPKTASPEEIRRAKQMRADGKTISAIAKAVGRSAGWVTRHVRGVKAQKAREPQKPETAEAAPAPQKSVGTTVVDRVKAALPTAENRKRASWRTILLHRMRDEPMPRSTWKQVRLDDWGPATGPIARKRIEKSMEDDGASLDRLEEYVDRHIDAIPR